MTFAALGKPIDEAAKKVKIIGIDSAADTITLTAIGESFYEDARAVLAARGLAHATVQVEPPEGAGDCEKQAHW